MATHIQGADGGESGQDATTQTVVLNGVTAGNLIIVWVSWCNYDRTISVSDGTTTLTAGTKVWNPNQAGQFFYLLSANSGNRTYTATWPGGVVDFISMRVSEYNASGAWTFDAQNVGSGNSTSLLSGSINTTGTDEVVESGMSGFGAVTITSQQINSVNATIPAYSGTNVQIGYRLLNSTFSSGTATASVSSCVWVCNIIAFKAAAGGSAALSGTATASITEADVVAGGKTIIITLTGDTFIAAG